MRLPSYPWRFAHLAALWGYGVSQPVFSMLKGNPEFLVVRGSTHVDVVVFALLLAFLPPLLVVGVEALASLATAALERVLHLLAIWAFAALAGLQLVRLFDPERAATLLVPLIPALLVALLYLRSRGLQLFFSISLALPLLALLSFVATVPLAVDDHPGVDVAVKGNTPVVLLTFDEFPVSSLLRRDGSIDAVRYPNFSRLAEGATWYPHATTVHVSTTQAVPVVLTGQFPQHGDLPTLRDHPENLFTLLGQRYAVRASEQATRLCPSRYCPRTRNPVPLLDRQRGLFYDVAVGYLHRTLPASIRGGLPPIGERWGGFGDDGEADVRELVLGALDGNAWGAAINGAWGTKRSQVGDFVSSIRPKPARALYFEHALLPHSPWAFLPSGRQYGGAPIIEGIEDDFVRWRSSPELVHQALQRHLLQVGYSDRVLGMVLRQLRSAGLFDRALVVVTADHGASFRPNGFFREVAPENIADIAGIPLFVKYPSQRRGRVDPRDAKTIDIVPTIAAVVGARIPWHVDGRSLLQPAVPRRVAVMGFQEQVVTATSSAVAKGVLATARRNASLFGEGTDSMFRLGPHQELLGRSLVSLRPTVAVGADVRLEDEVQFGTVRKASGFLPARIRGEIRGLPLDAGMPLAIAVNGKVAAMTRTFQSHGQTRFASLVPETVLRDGRNAVGIYAVEASDMGVRLALLGETSDARSVAAQPTTAAPGFGPT